MNLRTVFKAQSIILLLNAIGGLFLTSTFLSSANFEVTADLITLGQFMGMTFLIISIWPLIHGEELRIWSLFLMVNSFFYNSIFIY